MISATIETSTIEAIQKLSKEKSRSFSSMVDICLRKGLTTISMESEIEEELKNFKTELLTKKMVSTKQLPLT